MKVAIIGSRSFDDYELVKYTMKAYFDETKQIISGGAKGADELAERWSEEFLKEKAIVIKPNWSDLSHPNALIKHNRNGEKYDATAGIRRNEKIVREADLIIAFWDEKSKGTHHVIRYARQLKKRLQVVKYRQQLQLELF